MPMSGWMSADELGCASVLGVEGSVGDGVDPHGNAEGVEA